MPEWETPDTRGKPLDFPVSVRLSPPDALATSKGASRIARTQQAVALPFRLGLAVRSVLVAIRPGLLPLAGDRLWAGSGDRYCQDRCRMRRQCPLCAIARMAISNHRHRLHSNDCIGDRATERGRTVDRSIDCSRRHDAAPVEARTADIGGRRVGGSLP